jgi:hypothetical protein
VCEPSAFSMVQRAQIAVVVVGVREEKTENQVTQLK